MFDNKVLRINERLYYKKRYSGIMEKITYLGTLPFLFSAIRVVKCWQSRNLKTGDHFAEESRWKDNIKMGLPINPLNPELNPICYLLALLAHHFLHVSRIRVNH